MTPTPLIVAAFGLVIGSFLNVCIYRLPRGESVVWPASRCTSCNRKLQWYENIPVLSYLALRGACRTCRSRISPVYPVVELLTAFVFVVLWTHVGPGWLLASRLVFACAMIVLAFIDLRHHILPNVITVPGIVVGLGLSLFTPPGFLAALIGVAAGGGVLLLTAWAYERVRHQQGLGMGDVKMLALIGAFLGWKLMLLTLVLASFAGAAVGIALIAAAKGDMKRALPFGTFLAAGAIVAALAGDAIVAWYAGFY